AVLDPRDQAKYLFEPLGKDVSRKITEGGVLVGGWNLGCGSSREHAVTSLLGAGAKLVVAKSFSRIFFRNAINNGLPVVISPELADALAEDGHVEVDLAVGTAKAGDTEIRFAPLPDELLNIL